MTFPDIRNIINIESSNNQAVIGIGTNGQEKIFCSESFKLLLGHGLDYFLHISLPLEVPKQLSQIIRSMVNNLNFQHLMILDLEKEEQIIDLLKSDYLTGLKVKAPKPKKKVRMMKNRKSEKKIFSTKSDKRLLKSATKNRRNAKRLRFDAKTSEVLTSWLLNNLENPYPSSSQKAKLAREAGLDVNQVQNWFINIRKRHVAPLRTGKRKPRSFLDFVLCSSEQSPPYQNFKRSSKGKRAAYEMATPLVISQSSIQDEARMDFLSQLSVESIQSTKFRSKKNLKEEEEHQEYDASEMGDVQSGGMLQLHTFYEPASITEMPSNKLEEEPLLQDLMEMMSD